MSAARRIRLGMIGGGQDAFIGAVHRMAARLDDRYAFVAGALSSTPEKSIRSGLALGLAPERSYPDYMSMLAGEAKRQDGVEIVAIVTPNHLHVPAAKACVAVGLHVICDKPLATSLSEANELASVVARGDAIFAVTYNYTGYPMVRQARAMVAAGEIGRVRLVQVEYAQDWLSTDLEATGQKQAAWRTDPKKSGPAGALGDIGTHAFNLAEFVAATRVESVACDLQATVPGRRVDDNAQMLLRFAGGARGGLWCSQIAIGHENGLRLRVYGETASLEWRQEDPNVLRFSVQGEPLRTITRASPVARPEAARVTRIPGGHPEGYLEAFATIYTEVARKIVARETGGDAGQILFPDIHEGLRGMAFIEAAIESSRSEGKWTALRR